MTNAEWCPLCSRIHDKAGFFCPPSAGPVIVRQSRPQGCDLCGRVDELRPYGPNGEWICFNCGMKDEKATKRAFQRRLDGDTSSEGRSE